MSKQRAFLSSLASAAVTNRKAFVDTGGCNDQCKTTTLIQSLRGGSSTSDDEEESDSEYEEEYDSDEEDEYDEEETDEEESDEEDASSSSPSSLATSLQSKATDQPYDTLLTPPPMQQMLISLSVMMLSQRIDIFSPRVVTIARAAFVAYLIAVQLFLLYVRTRVKQINDRTEIVISNPLASFVEGMQKESNNMMVKSLTSQILTTHSTVYEYDLQQIKTMQSGLLMPTLFIYFLHFRMKQMQPLIMQTVTGVTNLVYSPLWQVHVMGRRLERPFGSGVKAGREEEEKGMEESAEDKSGSEEVKDEQDDVDNESTDDEEDASDDSEDGSEDG